MGLVVKHHKHLWENNKPKRVRSQTSLILTWRGRGSCSPKRVINKARRLIEYTALHAAVCGRLWLQLRLYVRRRIFARVGLCACRRPRTFPTHETHRKIKIISFAHRPQDATNRKCLQSNSAEDFCQFLLGKAYTYLRFATILQRILARHMCVLRRSSTCLGDKKNKRGTKVCSHFLRFLNRRANPLVPLTR